MKSSHLYSFSAGKGGSKFTLLAICWLGPFRQTKSTFLVTLFFSLHIFINIMTLLTFSFSVFQEQNGQKALKRDLFLFLILRNTSPKQQGWQRLMHGLTHTLPPKIWPNLAFATQAREMLCSVPSANKLFLIGCLNIRQKRCMVT